eukprot:TRINITY_DN50126_c0_g1_i1.p2 TRINITY_DN50126_c0_g1~~TRINITY_DN50126_c0_g1_i1.p2  ORF type:complete len:103 (-),score=8.86 TRINITY_DN50126_c0_g1_i1:259-567(-)
MGLTQHTLLRLLLLLPQVLLVPDPSGCICCRYVFLFVELAVINTDRLGRIGPSLFPHDRHDEEPKCKASAENKLGSENGRDPENHQGRHMERVCNGDVGEHR